MTILIYQENDHIVIIKDVNVKDMPLKIIKKNKKAGKAGPGKNKKD